MLVLGSARGAGRVVGEAIVFFCSPFFFPFLFQLSLLTRSAFLKYSIVTLVFYLSRFTFTFLSFFYCCCCCCFCLLQFSLHRRWRPIFPSWRTPSTWCLGSMRSLLAFASCTACPIPLSERCRRRRPRQPQLLPRPKPLHHHQEEEEGELLRLFLLALVRVRLPRRRQRRPRHRGLRVGTWLVPSVAPLVVEEESCGPLPTGKQIEKSLMKKYRCPILLPFPTLSPPTNSHTPSLAHAHSFFL